MSPRYRDDMIADALKGHETDHCGSAPCADAVKLALLLSAPGINSIPQGRELSKPGYGNGNGRYVGGNKSTPAETYATEKQIAFILKLAAERDFFSLLDSDRQLVENARNGSARITRFAASRLIDTLLKTAYAASVSSNGFQKDRAPKAQAPKAELEAGIYRVGDDWFKVQKAVHGSGHMYAKQLVVDAPGSAHFEFASGAIRKITPDHKVSLEEAASFGRIYGVCCNCGATLTDENSIEAGIGPVCAKRF